MSASSSDDAAILLACSAALGHLSRGDLEAADAVLAVHAPQAHPRLDYLRGLLALAHDEPEAARLPLARAAKSLPSDAAVHANWTLCLYRCGDYPDALQASERALALASRHAANHHNRGLILLALNRYPDAAASFERATELAPTDANAWLRLGETRHANGRYLEAELALRRAVALRPDQAEVHIRLAAVLYDAGVFDIALQHAATAVELAPESAPARVQMSAALRRLGRVAEALVQAESAVAIAPDDPQARKSRALVLQMLDRLPEAAQDFTLAAQLNFSPQANPSPLPRELRRSSRAKLRHDIEQFRHLHAQGLLSDADSLIALHEHALAELPKDMAEGRTFDLPANWLKQLGGRYNRLHWLTDAPTLRQGALNPALDAAAIEADYFAREPGISWIDELLRPEALAALRRYCLDSTFWFDFHHVNGYLGAFFEDGFAAPLLLQIANELRERFPRIFRDYPLTQLWAFKYDSRLEGIEMHADIAAVNLNFWITPDAANLDPEHGGLVVWDRAAPPHWGFDEFNTSTDAGQARIQRFLDDNGAQAVRVPYRCNRAVVFNSDLFHRTDSIRFAPGYEDRRINITMLFGKRVGATR